MINIVFADNFYIKRPAGGKSIKIKVCALINTLQITACQKCGKPDESEYLA